MPSFEDACFQWASNQFLYAELSDDYFELSEEDQHTHLEQYAWEPISHQPGWRIATYIESLAQHAIQGIIPTKEASNMKEVIQTEYSVTWHVDDVLSERPDLTIEQASNVLDNLCSPGNHDATIGVNWDSIRHMAEHLYPEPETE